MVIPEGPGEAASAFSSVPEPPHPQQEEDSHLVTSLMPVGRSPLNQSRERVWEAVIMGCGYQACSDSTPRSNTSTPPSLLQQNQLTNRRKKPKCAQPGRRAAPGASRGGRAGQQPRAGPARSQRSPPPGSPPRTAVLEGARPGARFHFTGTLRLGESCDLPKVPSWLMVGPGPPPTTAEPWSAFPAGVSPQTGSNQLGKAFSPPPGDPRSSQRPPRGTSHLALT